METEKENLKVLSGQVWITLKGDQKDYVVKSGECFEIPGNVQDVLLEALDSNTQVQWQGRQAVTVNERPLWLKELYRDI